MSALTFRRLRIERLLGITDGIDLREVSPGLNIVYGPNASGKTTTARAIEALLWPAQAAPANALLSAVAGLDGDEWTIRVDAGHVVVRCNGRDETIPTPPAEDRDRYRLWLPDLLSADDAGFARRILIESSGGFDLDRAARSLDARHPRHRKLREQDALRAARERVVSATRAETALQAEAETLADKEARLARRAALRTRRDQLTLALELATARDRDAEASARLATWPAVLSKLHGNEAERVEALRAGISEAEGKRTKAADAATEAERALTRVSIPAAVLEGDLLDTLRADAAELSAVEREISDQEKGRVGAAQRLESVEKSFPSDVVEPARLDAIDLDRIAELRAAAEMVEETRTRRQTLEAELETLPDTPPPPDLERIRNGAFLLGQWLAETPIDREVERYRRLALAGAGLAFVAGLAVAALGAPWLAVAIAALAAGAAVVVLRPAERGDPRADREREFVALGLPDRPARWDPTSVEECRDRLARRVDEGRELERRWERRRQILGALDGLDRRQPVIDADLAELADRFGIGLPADAVRYLWLVQCLTDWRRARDERAAAEASLVETFRRRQSLLEVSNERLKSAGLPPVTDPRALTGIVERLTRDLATYERCAANLDRARDDLDRADEEVARLRQELRSVIDRLEIDPGDEHRLREWCEAVPAYREAVTEHQLAGSQLGQLEERVERTPDFDDALIGSAREPLEEERADIDRELADLETLDREVGSLTERIRAAKSAHGLEDALADERECIDALRDQRARELRAAVAAVLVDFVRRRTRREHLPRVYHRANDLFASITRHAYQLRVEEDGSGAFRALDTRTERIHSLEELSSGTRVQLLLAVRIAFVETLEPGARLPLLMDEVLANSDDERAASIMDAVLRIVAAGRQVFYFTAQPDEVAKWRAMLERHAGIPSSVHDLAAIRGLDRRLDPAALARVPTPPPAPAIPHDADHPDIPSIVPVPGIDLFAPPGSMHLWYVVDDADVLRRLLTEVRISTWGELRSLIDANADGVLDAGSEGTVAAIGRLAERAIAELRIGRGRPADRQALLESNAVSDRFIDEVAALAATVDGNASAIVAALEARAVPGFQARKLEALVEFFEREEFLDPRPRLAYPEIRRRLIAAAAPDLGTVIDVRRIDRLIQRLAAGAGIELEPPTSETDQPRLPLVDPPA